MPGVYTIRLDPSVSPVQHTRRKVPIECREAIEKLLQDMVDQAIIAPVTEPTEWCHLWHTPIRQMVPSTYVLTPVTSIKLSSRNITKLQPVAVHEYANSTSAHDTVLEHRFSPTRTPFTSWQYANERGQGWSCAVSSSRFHTINTARVHTQSCILHHTSEETTPTQQLQQR